ncbi:hypothetical protein [Tropicimonas isoalkanivorans]|uniref:Uncharacterized protein n=1 Tax=Tropicimonas isoalkanivorans TaxID=441112 RepID=A0A1I1IGI0_9RHOB|nr:hypothetical protein [Tropicimonas isoalkanivorans]SFC35404.1 hypothetical protein SAMN04488094_10483 [Tropicimonas isoalkanivorans]
MILKERVFWTVSAFGAIGAILGFGHNFIQTHSLPENWMIDLLIVSFLGAFSGGLFIFLLANTDREDIPRLVILATLSGFFWKPVIEAGQLYINKSREEQLATKASDAIQEIAELNNAASNGMIDKQEAIQRSLKSASVISESLHSIDSQSTSKALAAQLGYQSTQLDPEFLNAIQAVEGLDFYKGSNPDTTVGITPLPFQMTDPSNPIGEGYYNGSIKGLLDGFYGTIADPQKNGG